MDPTLFCSAWELPLLLTTLAREVMQSPPPVRPSVRLSIRCFHSIFRTNWPLTLNFCMWVDHDYSSQGIEGQGHRSWSRSWVRLMWSVRPWSRAVFSIVSACSYRQCFSSPVPTFIVDAVIITSKSISLLKLDMWIIMQHQSTSSGPVSLKSYKSSSKRLLNHAWPRRHKQREHSVVSTATWSLHACEFAWVKLLVSLLFICVVC